MQRQYRDDVEVVTRSREGIKITEPKPFEMFLKPKPAFGSDRALIRMNHFSSQYRFEWKGREGFYIGSLFI